MLEGKSAEEQINYLLGTLFGMKPLQNQISICKHTLHSYELMTTSYLNRMLRQNSYIMKSSEYSKRRKGQHLLDAQICKIIKIYQANQLKNEEICKLFSISLRTLYGIITMFK